MTPPDITVKNDDEEPPEIQAEGFAHIGDGPFSIQMELEEATRGQLHVDDWQRRGVLFVELELEEFEEGSMGFYMGPTDADRLAEELLAHAEYLRSGEWRDPEWRHLEGEDAE